MNMDCIFKYPCSMSNEKIILLTRYYRNNGSLELIRHEEYHQKMKRSQTIKIYLPNCCYRKRASPRYSYKFEIYESFSYQRFSVKAYNIKCA